MYNVLYQTHIGTWAILLLVVIVSLFYRSFYLKIFFRVLAVLMLTSGIGLAISLSFPFVFVMKLIIAILCIGLVEMLLKREKPIKSYVLLGSTFVSFLLLCLIGFGVIRF
ncbi:DUF1516 family protein [Shouchella hunanensis]|uniref:DUF1516 family protein n=1 Tax=Shouchella hunanensis TaxID=766894 RepID=A0ABY7W051_9BACI|nr:DUF1516 family protein [Shouchella hunanensis]WDF02058.1 DUF1516 family protein [Shouchella hunanensis]